MADANGGNASTEGLQRGENNDSPEADVPTDTGDSVI